MAFSEPERIETVVVGGGQAGLSVGYYFAQRGLPFVILDANGGWETPGEPLGLAPFVHSTPLRWSGGGAHSWTDRLVSLKGRGGRLPRSLRGAVRATSSKRSQSASINQERRGFCGEKIVGSSHTTLWSPWGHTRSLGSPMPARSDRASCQMHSADYRNPSQLQEGGVLVVGVGNSSGEIALELSGEHPVWEQEVGFESAGGADEREVLQRPL